VQHAQWQSHSAWESHELEDSLQLSFGEHTDQGNWFASEYQTSGVPWDLSNGEMLHSPVVHGTGAGSTIDPRFLRGPEPNAPELICPGPPLDTTIPIEYQTTQDGANQLGDFDLYDEAVTSQFTEPIIFPDPVAFHLPDTSTHDAPVSPVTFREVSHALDE
jgi:hypothetical protein